MLRYTDVLPSIRMGMGEIGELDMYRVVDILAILDDPDTRGWQRRAAILYLSHSGRERRRGEFIPDSVAEYFGCNQLKTRKWLQMEENGEEDPG